MSSGESISGMRRIPRIMLCINVFILLETVAFPVFAACTFLAVLIYWNRRADAWPWLVPIAFLTILAVLAVWTWKRCSSRFFSRKDTLALVDNRLGLNAALSAEEEWGVHGESMSVPSGSVLKINSAPALAWLVGGVAMLLAGGLLPLPDRGKDIPRYSEKSPALAQVEDWLDRLDEMEEVDPESTESLKKEMEELMKMSGEDMYSHAGLEAADALASRTSSAMNEMAQNMAGVDTALQKSMQSGSSANAAEDLKQALKAMEQGMLKPGGKCAGEMAGMTADGMSGLSKEQLQQLADQLRNASNKLNEMCSNSGSLSPVANPEDYPELKECDGDGNENGKGKWGRGGAGRGRGDAPLMFGDSNQQLQDGSMRGVSNTDMSHAALGSVTGTQSSAPTLDEDGREADNRGGKASVPARGGDSIWKDELAPAERDAMRSFFK